MFDLPDCWLRAPWVIRPILFFCCFYSHANFWPFRWRPPQGGRVWPKVSSLCHHREGGSDQKCHLTLREKWDGERRRRRSCFLSYAAVKAILYTFFKVASNLHFLVSLFRLKKRSNMISCLSAEERYSIIIWECQVSPVIRGREGSDQSVIKVS